MVMRTRVKKIRLKKFVDLVTRERISARTVESLKSKVWFHNVGKELLRDMADLMGLKEGTYDVRSNVAGPAVSGEVVLHGDRVYVSLGQGVAMHDVFMYRSCKDRRDYVGGPNHWMKWVDLLDLPKAAERVALVMGSVVEFQSELRRGLSDARR